MKTISKFSSLVFICLLFFTNLSESAAQTSAQKVWFGYWRVETDSYVGDLKIQLDKTREWTSAELLLFDKRTQKLMYKFESLTGPQSRNTKGHELLLRGSGKRMSDGSLFSTAVQLYNFRTNKDAVGYFQLSSGRNAGGIKLAFKATKS